jgi:diguanylate cyclase (GGDEF)-like protein/PAS domain S-box-containing protein
MDILEELEKRAGVKLTGPNLQSYFVGYKDILDNMSEGLYFVDRERRIIYWNKGAEIISGFASTEVLHRSCSENVLIHVNDKGESLCDGACPLADTMTDGQPRKTLVFMHAKAGHRLPVVVNTCPIKDERGAIIGGVEMFLDHSSPMAVMERVSDLQDAAALDPATGVAAWPLVEDFVLNRLRELNLFHWPYGLAAVKLDGVDEINRRYGPQMGQQSLQMVAQTMARNVRSFDLVGAGEGIELVAVLANFQRDPLRLALERLLHLIRQSRLPHPSGDIMVTASMGATTARDNDTVATLWQRAQDLLAQSQASGGNCITMG